MKKLGFFEIGSLDEAGDFDEKKVKRCCDTF